MFDIKLVAVANNILPYMPCQKNNNKQTTEQRKMFFPPVNFKTSTKPLIKCRTVQDALGKKGFRTKCRFYL